MHQQDSRHSTLPLPQFAPGMYSRLSGICTATFAYTSVCFGPACALQSDGVGERCGREASISTPTYSSRLASPYHPPTYALVRDIFWLLYALLRAFEYILIFYAFGLWLSFSLQNGRDKLDPNIKWCQWAEWNGGVNSWQ